MNGQSLVGRVGTVVVAVRGGELPGEVRVVVEGLPHYYIAYCGEAVLKGQHVLVINSRGSRQLDVEPWDEHSPVIAEVLDRNERH